MGDIVGLCEQLRFEPRLDEECECKLVRAVLEVGGIIGIKGASLEGGLLYLAMATL